MRPDAHAVTTREPPPTAGFRVGPPSGWLGGIVWVWTALVLARGLQDSIYPRTHWVVSAAAATLVAPFLLRVRFATFAPGLLPAWLLAASVLLSSVGSPDPLYGLAEAGKLGIMLVVTLTLFVTHSRYAHYAFRAFVFSTYLNVVLLLAGLLGVATLSREMMLRRWGTLLDYPGSLWRVGILSVGWSAYLLLARDKPVQRLAVLAASLALIYFDGSRTGFLLLCLVAVPFLLVVRVVERRSLVSRLATVGAAFVLTLALVAGWNWAASQRSASQASGSLGRIAQLASSLRLEGATGLAAADPVRARMLQTGLAALREAGVVGSGIETTRAGTEEGLFVLHMTYFQVLGDLGLLGLVAYLWLTLGWLLWLPRAWANIRGMVSTPQRGLYYNAILLLFLFALAALFHPLSTEWSEWITFVIPYALFWEAVRATPLAEQANVAP